MQFNYKLDNKEYLLNGITLAKFKELQFYISIKDNKQILNYFNFWINNIQNINIFDQFKLLLYNLLLTTRNSYEFTLDNENNKYKYSINIEDIIKNINSINISDYKINLNENSYVVIGIPNEFFIYNEQTLQNDLLNYNTYKYIKEIVIDNEKIPLLEAIIDQLPSNVLSQISNKIKDWDNVLKNIPIFNKNIEANCQIVTLFEFIKKIFTYNNKELLFKEYTLFKYIRILNYDTINLHEADAFIKIFNEDLKQQQDEIESNMAVSNRSINIPSKQK